MEKGNKNRLIVWGGIWLFCLLIGIGGLVSFYNGYGRIGQARKKLAPVVEKFNEVDTIIRYGGIKAEIVKDKIVVTQTSGSSTKKYEYEYSVENGRDIITNVYNKNDSVVGETIAKGMIDAVYKLNGGTGSVFEEYQYTVFKNTTTDMGVNLLVGDNNQIKINLNENIVQNIKDIQENIDDNQINYINANDLLKLKDDLKENGNVKLEKNTIVVFIIEKENNYVIYAYDSDRASTKLKDSLDNIILKLNESAWNSAVAKDEKYHSASNGDGYKVETEYDDVDNIGKEFIDGAVIIKVTVDK